MKKQTATPEKRQVVKVKRKGIHAKTKTSALMTSKHYKKLNRGQGK